MLSSFHFDLFSAIFFCFFFLNCYSSFFIIFQHKSPSPGQFVTHPRLINTLRIVLFLLHAMELTRSSHHLRHTNRWLFIICIIPVFFFFFSHSIDEDVLLIYLFFPTLRIEFLFCIAYFFLSSFHFA